MRRAWYAALTGLGAVGVAVQGHAPGWLDRGATVLVIIALGIAAVRGASNK